MKRLYGFICDMVSDFTWYCIKLPFLRIKTYIKNTWKNNS